MKKALKEILEFDKQVFIEERSDGKFQFVYREIISAPGGVIETDCHTFPTLFCPYCGKMFVSEKEKQAKTSKLPPQGQGTPDIGCIF